MPIDSDFGSPESPADAARVIVIVIPIIPPAETKADWSRAWKRPTFMAARDENGRIKGPV